MRGKKEEKNFTTNLVALFVVNLFLLISCSDDINIGERTLPEGKGSLSIYIDEISSSRTILPQNTDWSSFTGTFEIAITKAGTAVFSDTRSINNLSDPIQLDAGDYKVAVTAHLSAGVPIAKGEIEISVTAGIPEAHILRLYSIIDSGTGTFRWEITIPSVISAQLAITQTNGTLVGTIVTLTQGVNTSSRDLVSGYYFVTTTLSRINHADIVRRDVLHVYQNMTSVFTVEFTDTIFNSNLHNVIFDHGYGGLSDSIPVIHGGKAVRPVNPTRAGYTFMDWYADAALSTLYDFDSIVSKDITLYAGWDFLGTVTVTSGTTTIYHANLDAAFNSITTAGNYTVTLLENQTLGARTLSTAGVNITLVSSETGAANERIIQYNGAASVYMFFMTSGVSLTLGNNITLVGIPGGSMSLLYVQNGTLTMQSGSKITGHTTSRDVIVIEGANSRFVMSGGTITGNTTTWAGGSDLSGGVLINSGATAAITGGSITGNSPVDLFINSATIFNLSGNAAVGNIRLNASSAISNANITLGAFTGTVGTLNLRSENAVMDTVINWWLNKQVIQAAAGYTLTATDVAKFTLGNFISSNVSVTRAIGDTYYIGTGTDLGRLVSKFGSGTAADPFLINNETDLRAVGRGTYNGANWSTSAHYRLMNNITLTQGNWTRIGDLATGFSGTFNGNGKTITGMTIAASSAGYQGMFCFVSPEGVVRNLGLVNVNITGVRNVGGIAGDNEGTIENCFVTGSITGTDIEVGGIAGSNIINGTIQNCYVIANITGTDEVGGITGYASFGIIRNCYVAGTITGSVVRSTYGVGGITGSNNVPVQNTVTLLQSITVTSGTNYNKIIGYNLSGGSLTNNRAWSGTTFSPSKTATSSLTGVNGLDVTAAALKTQATWQTSGAAFSFGTNDTSPWVWQDGKMPRLYWETSGRDWPSYLVEAGTTADPFLIYNETDLRAVGRGSYNGMNWSLSAHYRLMNNITLTGGNWTPIGDNANPFTGVFNGNGRIITGVTINAPADVRQGFFGVINSGGTVRNLGLENVSITGSIRVGGIAGLLNSDANGGSLIENSFVTGTVRGNDRVGGIIGGAARTVTGNPLAVVRNCYSLATVEVIEGNEQDGDFGGSITGAATGTIENCFAASDLISGTQRIGGMAGNINNGILRNSITFTREVIGSGASFTNRLLGSNTAATLSNNLVWNGVTVMMNGAPFRPEDGSNNAGTGISASQIKTQNTWTAATFAFGTNDTSPWVWESGKMPRLYWETSGRDWPAYLVD